jgi:hypothetical protein
MRLSFDHSPGADSERRRIEAAGGVVRHLKVRRSRRCGQAPKGDSCTYMYVVVLYYTINRGHGEFSFQTKPGQKSRFAPLPGT